mgnify:CR=1 FL=1
MTHKPCLDCGAPSASTRCSAHRGYDAAWDRLSRRARKVQPWCSDCGSTEDLQADHSPEAWARHAAGKRIRLRDVDVVCGPCNRERGPARPEVLQHNGFRHTKSVVPQRRSVGDGPRAKLSQDAPAAESVTHQTPCAATTFGARKALQSNDFHVGGAA